MSSSTFIEPLDAHLESAIADKQPENSIEVFPSKISHITPPAIFAEYQFELEKLKGNRKISRLFRIDENRRLVGDEDQIRRDMIRNRRMKQAELPPVLDEWSDEEDTNHSDSKPSLEEPVDPTSDTPNETSSSLLPVLVEPVAHRPLAFVFSATPLQQPSSSTASSSALDLAQPRPLNLSSASAPTASAVPMLQRPEVRKLLAPPSPLVSNLVCGVIASQANVSEEQVKDEFKNANSASKIGTFVGLLSSGKELDNVLSRQKIPVKIQQHIARMQADPSIEKNVLGRLQNLTTWI